MSDEQSIAAELSLAIYVCMTDVLEDVSALYRLQVPTKVAQVEPGLPRVVSTSRQAEAAVALLWIHDIIHGTRSHGREPGPYRSGMCAFHPGELGLLVPMDDAGLVVVLIALVMLKRSLTCGRWPPRGGREMPSSPLCLIPDGNTSVPSGSAVFLQDLLIYAARLAHEIGICDEEPMPEKDLPDHVGYANLLLDLRCAR